MPPRGATDNFEAALFDDFTDTDDAETHYCGPLIFQCKHCSAIFFSQKDSLSVLPLNRD